MTDPTSAAGWIVTARESDTDAATHTLDVLRRHVVATSHSSQLDLEEPLVTSADLVSGVADVLCTADHIDPTGCSWYHGTWQYLRLANLVSTPTWHHSFYQENLAESIASRADSRVLISGTADYSLLAYVLGAARDATAHAEITVLDMCPTPLFACQWLAKREGHRIRTTQEDVLNCTSLALGAFDVIATDAFLTRFGAGGTPQILRAWHSLLAPGGLVITTVRLHDLNPVIRDTEALIQAFVDRGRIAFERWSVFLRTPLEDLVLRADAYARRMKSLRVASPAEIPVMFHEAGFEVIFTEVAEVPGELQPTSYMRLVARRR